MVPESDVKPSRLLLTLFCVGMRQGASVLVMDLSHRQLTSIRLINSGSCNCLHVT